MSHTVAPAGNLGWDVARRTQFRLLVVITLAWLAWAGSSFLLDHSQPFTMRVVDDIGTPITGAVVAIEQRQLGLTGTEGMVEVDWSDGSPPFQVSAPGHVPARMAMPSAPDTVIDAVLKARILRGRVLDPGGAPVEGAYVTAGPAEAVTDAAGRFAARGAEPGTVRIDRPAWAATTFEWEGGAGETESVIEPLVIRAVHIGGDAAAQRFDEYLAMAETTELNGIMLDLKDESGLVLYDSEVAVAQEVGAVVGLFDLEELASQAAESDLYVIGRIVTFQDPIAAVQAPDMSVWDTATNAPFQSGGQYFLDPSNLEARAYALDMAVEACQMGVDEVQFDYVRYPDARPETVEFDADITVNIRIDTIRTFLSEAAGLLHPMDCAVGTDVFGFLTTAIDDGGIGQRWEDITSVVDVASPMVYPSHYGSGWDGFDNPNDHPGPVVANALDDGLERLSRQIVVRPWLQDFGYTPGQVRAQIDMAEERGLGWMLWNALSNVSTGALEPPE